LLFLADDRAVTAAVAGGKADIGLAGVSDTLYRFAAAHGLKIFASRSSDQTGFPLYTLLVSAKARAGGFTDIRALPHRRIGLAEADAGAAYALFAIAVRFGLDFGTLNIIAEGSRATALGALSRGEIDAVLLPYPLARRSARRDQSLLVLSDFARWQQGVVFTTAAMIATRRDFIARFMHAYQRGTAGYELNFLSYDDAGDFIPGPHYDAYLHAIARQLRLTPDFLAMTKAYCDRRANLDIADIEKQLRFWQSQGRIDQHLALSDLVDPSFIGEEMPSPSP
jgi:NitT/TauT family transport system substrate-binding protein